MQFFIILPLTDLLAILDLSLIEVAAVVFFSFITPENERFISQG